MTKVAIDAMGGDFGPAPIVEGVVQAYRSYNFEPILVGKSSEILPLLPKDLKNKIEIIEADDVIEMSDAATDALKRKDSSIYKAVDLVRNKEADAVVSAGHSGASMSLATLRIGRIKGVQRPAIATLMPSSIDKQTLVLDVGANVDSKAENLFQFAIMGKAYAEDVMKIRNPRIGLLSNGEEDSKGNEITKEAFALLKDQEGFVGNVEGNNIFDGSVDVITCDGFVGNILLKTSEGVASTISGFIKKNIRRSPLAVTGALLMKKVFKLLKKKVDYAEYGGAPLLGVKGCVIISHGKSNAKAIKNAIRQAIQYSDSEIESNIEAQLS